MFLKGVGVILVLLLWGDTVKCLHPYQLYSEGSCSRIRGQPARNLNRDSLVGMKYVLAGSRYHLLRLASFYQDYDFVTEEDLKNDYCMEHNLTNYREDSVITVNGFGSPLVSFDIRTPLEEESGVLLDAIPRDPSFPRWDVLRQHVTLTDNVNFAFVVNCWTATDQAGWILISRSPTLSEGTRRLVVAHARELGFNRKYFVSLSYDNCADHSDQGQNEMVEEGTSIRQPPLLNSPADYDNSPQLLRQQRDQPEIQRRAMTLTSSEIEDLLGLSNRRSLVRPEIIKGFRSLLSSSVRSRSQKGESDSLEVEDIHGAKAKPGNQRPEEVKENDNKSGEKGGASGILEELLKRPSGQGGSGRDSELIERARSAVA